MPPDATDPGVPAPAGGPALSPVEGLLARALENQTAAIVGELRSLRWEVKAALGVVALALILLAASAGVEVRTAGVSAGRPGQSAAPAAPAVDFGPPAPADGIGPVSIDTAAASAQER